MLQSLSKSKIENFQYQLLIAIPDSIVSSLPEHLTILTIVSKAVIAICSLILVIYNLGRRKSLKNFENMKIQKIL